MQDNAKLTTLYILLGCSVMIFLASGLAFVLPWQSIRWGSVEVGARPTVTVTGTAKMQQQNQKATFSAGINVVNDSKDVAIAQANKQINDILDAAKKFGIKADDLKTENMSINQNEESYYEDGRQKSRLGQWRVSNSISITLRDVSRASGLTEVLSKAGATNIYGPNFSMDDTDAIENQLLAGAVADAKNKAGLIAKADNKKVGAIISATEGSGGSNFYPLMAAKGDGIGGGGGAETEPGTATVTKSVTVTFELK